jgi:hypothetical protein
VLRRRRLLALAVLPALVGCGGAHRQATAARVPAAATRPELGPPLDRNHLPALPRDFLVVERARSAVLVRLDGTVLGHLDRLRPMMLASSPALLGNVQAETIDRAERRLVAFTGHAVMRPGLVAHVRPASPHGRWIGAFRSPDGKRLLLQWSDECETPFAFLASAVGGKARLVTGESSLQGAPESYALGWTRDGRALVELPHGECGGGTTPPGVYAFVPGGSRTLVARGTAAAFFRG